MTSPSWPAKLPVRHVRIARPTDQLDEVVRFYREGLGLPELSRRRSVRPAHQVMPATLRPGTLRRPYSVLPKR